MSSFENEFGHLKLPLIDIRVATNNFSDENLIGRGGFGKIYKGQLLISGKLIDIVARRLNRKYGQGDKEFKTEIMMLASLKHPNLVSIVGFCDEDEEKIVINKFEANGSLDRYLNDPVKLTWTQRLHICLDIALALSYVHYDTQRSFSVIHRNIKSSKILLGGKWEAKLSGFGISTMQPAGQRHDIVLDNVTGTFGYVDPSYISSGGVTYKSDVYSFGVVLFEVLTGRKAYIRDNGKEKSLAQLAKSHYENDNLDDIIRPDLRKQMDQGSLKKFSEAAYCCLNEQRSQRPNIDQLIIALEQALELQGGNLNHLCIPLTDIRRATNDFSETCIIGFGGFGKVYKAELEHFDDINLLVAEGNNEGVLPKKRSTVAIKRVFSRVDGHQEKFLAEIEMLSKCRHSNIVSLVGFCDEESEMILVFEYMSKGSLDDCLGNAFNLTWAQRLQLCLDVAHGLNYLHTSTKDKPRIIHRDIKSANILLDDKWVAKIADFGLSNLYKTNQEASTILTNNVAGTSMYLDPEYGRTGRLKTKSDIYSFGVVLFEIMCGKLAYDKTYKEKGLASIVRQCFKEGTLKNLLDPKLKEADGTISTENRGVNQYSLDTFLKVAYKCLAKKQSDRPTMDEIVEELVKALNIQKYSEFAHLAIPLEEILSATNSFDDENLIREGGFGKDYRGQILRSGDLIDICARRLKWKDGRGDVKFWTEISMLSSLNHKNIISLIGLCYEDDEKIIVYEFAVHGSLDGHLRGPNLTWFQRLKICLGVAHGLSYIHYDVVHCDINSSKIFLDKDWDPKISGFELSTKYPQSWRHRILSSLSFDNTTMTPKYDVYCFGVLLFEVLYAEKPMKTQRQGIINPKLQEQMDRQSLTFLTNIIDKCLSEHPVQRPTMDQVVKELEDVFELQWKHENLEHSTSADKDHEGTSSGLLKYSTS
ncbi:receptor like protein kinase S.2-like [Bidens hawaiensis]|uniref:receptor like protein kinase S.2-like n=1 Tax=Bidens hawaiensis TaxID=980011 RepID=UPI0040490F24